VCFRNPGWALHIDVRRLLIKGRLLQLLLPCEVRPDASNAQRSTLSGRLVLTMPKEDVKAYVDVAKIRPKQATAGSKDSALTAVSTKTAAGTILGAGPVAGVNKAAGQAGSGAQGKAAAAPGGEFIIREVRKAAVHAMDEDDEDFIPDL
jgi:protein TilB